MNQSRPIGLKQGVATIAAGLGIAAVMVWLFGGEGSADRRPGDVDEVTSVVHREGARGAKADKKDLAGIVRARPAPEFVDKGIEWIVKAQNPNGGWGAGSHAHQEIRDPHAVAVDPATTAFVASALLRSGSTPFDGKHYASVRRATEYLCTVVEEYSKPGPRITDLEGTQIQAKLGPLVDTAMTAQFLARVLPTVPTGDALHGRIDKALDKCLAKLNESQQQDGSWNVGGGWANVLQSSLACSALEFAQAAGKNVDGERLDKARKYNLGNYDAKTGATNTEASAGVSLYAFSSSMRANVAQAKAASDFLDSAKVAGILEADAPLNEENLKKAGVQPEAARDLVAANVNVNAQNYAINGGTAGTAALKVDVPAGALSGFGGLGGGIGGGAGLGGSVASTSGPVSAASALPAAETVAVAEPSGLTKAGAGTLTLGGAATYTGGTAGSGGIVSLSGVAGRTYAGETATTTEEAILAGFGNNGGEEFLSYMLAAESTVILGEKDWNNWYDKMGGRLSKVQNPDGSWSGHHCITSPVFCTAAVVQTMTADHDAEMLTRLAKEAAALAKVDVKEAAKQ